MASGLRGEAPKIVQIETRYVQTDATNFRDVVQSLTGKNSSIAWIGQNTGSSSVAGSEIKGGTAGTAKLKEDAISNGKKETLVPSMLINSVSFKDFDRLLLEFPPMEMEGRPWF